MPTIEELTKKYQEYSDVELNDIYYKFNDYSEEARSALTIVINERGGIESFKERIEKQNEIDNEIAKLDYEILGLLYKNHNKAEIKNFIVSNILTDEQIDELIETKIEIFEQEQEDKKIKPRTVIGSLLGGAIGGTIGGIMWGVQMIYSNGIILFVGIAVVLLTYFFIRIFTKQSKQNTVVLIMTAVSSSYAFFLGYSLYHIIGYKGP